MKVFYIVCLISLELRRKFQKQKVSPFKNLDSLKNKRSQRYNILDFLVSHKAQ